MTEKIKSYWPATQEQPQPEQHKGGVSPTKVIEVLQDILAPDEHTETGANDIAPDKDEGEDVPAPQDYIEGDLR